MTTERILPSVALPSPARPRLLPEAYPRPVPRPAPGSAPGSAVHRARPAVTGREAILGTPTRAGLLIGVSAAVYAVTLAGIGVLQADSDAAIAAARRPYLETLAAGRSANDALEAALLRVDAQARGLANTYARVGDDVGGYQARLDELASLVAEVEGSAAALPTRISLPSVTMRGAVGGSGRAPATVSRSGASGAP